MPSQEKFMPPPTLPPDGTFFGAVMFAMRRFFDLQVASVLQQLVPWLSAAQGRVLEVGCGRQPYRHLLPVSCVYQGLDWKMSQEHFHCSAPDTVYYDGEVFPFASNAFDNLFHTEVIEHVYHTAAFLSECRRVLKSGARMFFAVPFQARYHYIPYDYWRFTPASLERLLAETGFCDVRITPRGNDITVAVYKNISVVYRWLQSGFMSKVIGVLLMPFVCILLLVGHVSLRCRMGSPDDCLGYIVVAKNG